MVRLTQGKTQTGQISIIGGTATGSAGASTLNRSAGVITTESVTTAAGASYTHTLTNDHVTADDIVLVEVSSQGPGTPVVTRVIPGEGSVVIVVQNIHAENAFGAALRLRFLVVKLS